MTKNQIEYNKLVEDMRSNREQERLTEQRDTRSHAVAVEGLTETKRHNEAQEVLGRGNLNETIRSNMAKETETNRSNVAKETETARHNVSVESETKRSNLRQESLRSQELAETARHNQSSEDIGLRQAIASTMQASASQTQARVAVSRAAEEARANLARETETHRSNVARETETNRANVANETETHRANVERERENAAHHTAQDVTGLLKVGNDIANTVLKVALPVTKLGG